MSETRVSFSLLSQLPPQAASAHGAPGSRFPVACERSPQKWLQQIAEEPWVTGPCLGQSLWRGAEYSN